MAYVHIRSNTPVFTPSQQHRKAAAAAATATPSTEIRLDYVIINITINEIKTKAVI